MVQNIEETTGDATKKLLLNSFHVNEDLEKHEKHGIFYGLYFGRQRFSKC